MNYFFSFYRHIGWGSLSLYLAQVSSLLPFTFIQFTHIAQKYPKSRIVGLSNSKTQREYITSRAQERGHNNLEVPPILETTYCIYLFTP